ncbi:BEM_collapsed_G0016610.mRNA.1.CDS.1 [Saccharomyces cerevisiae]|nr:BEM_collapsed_G0016610.mRNA.1.CDS.1 [Saccharomyces cerevisiae]
MFPSNEESDESDHAIINPLKLVGNNKDISTKALLRQRIHLSLADLLAAISEPSSSPSPSAPSPSVQSSSSSHGLVVRKKTGSMQKTRGRKPLFNSDASKQFGCEFCDRRFKKTRAFEEACQIFTYVRKTIYMPYL